MSRSVAAILAIIAIVAVGVVVADDSADGYVSVPGGLMLHKSCVRAIPDGFHVEAANDNSGSSVMVNTLTGAAVTLSPCKYPSKYPNGQIYDMDTHFTASSGLMKTFNATFNVPAKPTKDEGQVLFFWPGFKSTEPTMGFPVLQPVLQYGRAYDGGGPYWVIASWYVCGQTGDAFYSTVINVNPNDIIYSSMNFDTPTNTWIIYANNTRTGRDTTLKITRSKIGNIDFKVAMLVLETITSSQHCSQYPASPQIIFSDVLVNGVVPTWTPRVQLKDCGQQVDISSGGATVKMSWVNK